jgi:hypothetical protein
MNDKKKIMDIFILMKIYTEPDTITISEYINIFKATDLYKKKLSSVIKDILLDSPTHLLKNYCNYKMEYKNYCDINDDTLFYEISDGILDDMNTYYKDKINFNYNDKYE